MRKLTGFTIVELIIVIVLVGIISVVVAARFLSPNTFSALVAQDALIGAIRSAQQAALGRSNVTFEITPAGDDWVFTATAGSTILRTFEVSGGDLILETGSAAASVNSCAVDFDDALDNFELAYGSTGDLISFTNGSTEFVNSTFNGVRICINDDVEFSVCVSPSGYAYKGDCDD